ncbi:MAG TPA: hypothetical protein VMO17_07675 [Terriglobia bacterium]|nr:hypothetical protein [Terriglobia bacterium]
MPDHGRAIFYPPNPLTLWRVMESIKVGATKIINRSRREAGLLFQPRFFDRAQRTVREYHEKVEYITSYPLATPAGPETIPDTILLPCWNYPFASPPLGARYFGLPNNQAA